MGSNGMLLRRLAEAVVLDPPAGSLVKQVCTAVRDLLGADGAALTVEASTPHRVTVCTTDRRSDLLEDIQEVLGEGPCLDAFDYGRMVTAALDEAACARWPFFTPAARDIIGEAGMLWSVPMHSGGEVIGAASVYCVRRGPLAEPPAGAQVLADAVGAALVADPEAYAEAPGSGGWASRAIVHQATGILIAQLGVAADAALDVLRSRAFAVGAQLRDVARDVVERRLDLSCG